jgi:DNA-binding MarR family transcriptional regulator
MFHREDWVPAVTRRGRTAPRDPAAPDALAEAFIDVMKRMHRASARARVGELSNARYELLHTVFHQGAQPMRVVAAALGVTARSVTDMADALVADGYLSRSPDPDDRRVIRLELTDSGLAAVHAARHARIAEGAALFGQLSTTDRAELAAILARLNAIE